MSKSAGAPLAEGAQNGDEAGPEQADDPHPASGFLPISVIVAVATLGVLALFTVTVAGQGWAAFSALLVMAAAATAIGGLAGFLFGIPRSLQDGAASRPSPDGDQQQPAYAVNTNLEQISDWLTKILVGIGLVQIARAPSAFGRLVGDLAADLGGKPIDRLMAGGVVIFFPIFGFLLSYLMTRLLLRRAFTQADLATVSAIAAQAARKVVRSQEQKDASAFSVVADQLSPPPGTDPPGAQQVISALAEASPVLRSRVFSLARNQRDRAWRDQDKQTLRRTIPVFLALVAADPQLHRNHGQLGYALKDNDPPDWAGAEKELSQAIALREHQGEHGWLYYELNRATLNIRRDLADLPGARDNRASILSDLRAAARDDYLKTTMIYDDPEIQEWLCTRAPEAADLLRPDAGAAAGA